MTTSWASVNEMERRPSFEPLEPRLMLNAAPTDINLSHNRVNEQAGDGTLVAVLSGSDPDGDGDGTGGDDYNFTFFVLKCDANGDGRVDSGDLAAWQQNYDPLGLNDNNPGTADFNGDGKVDSSDLALWQQRHNPLGLQEPAAGSDAVAAMAIKAVAESPAGQEALNPTVEWTFTDLTVGDGATALWVSPTVIDPNFPLYDYTYEITKTEVYLDIPLVGE